ncbi:ephrin-A4-like [Arapaima gigas]
MGGRRARGGPALWRLTLLLLQVVSAARARRHAVYWNSTNARVATGLAGVVPRASSAVTCRPSGSAARVRRPPAGGLGGHEASNCVAREPEVVQLEVVSV